MPGFNPLSWSLQNRALRTDEPRRPESADDLLLRYEVNTTNRAQLHAGHTACLQRSRSEGSLLLAGYSGAKENPAAPAPAMPHILSLPPLDNPALAARTAPPPIYPVRDFFRNADQSYFRASGDGRWLAFMRPVSVDGQPPRLNIFVQKLKGATPIGEARQLTSESARDINKYVWKGSDAILYSKDFGGDENFHVLAVNPRSDGVLDLTPYDKVRAYISDDLEDDPDHILIAHNQRNPRIFDVYRVNIHTGESVLAAQNPGNVIGWQTDHAGKVRAAFTNDGLTASVLYRDNEQEPFRTIITTDYRTSVRPRLFTFDNKQLYAFSDRGRDTKALVRIDPERPDEEEVVFAPQRVDVTDVRYSLDRRVLTEVSYETDKPQRKFFDRYTENIYRKLADRLPGYEFRLQKSESRDEDKFVVAAYNDRTMGARYLYDVKTDELHKLADINPALPEADMAPMQPISYKSRDGLTVHGYLILPLGREPRNLPLIVRPHGGPWSRDRWGYNPEVQLLANQGFAVLLINFRGSTGYGRAFWEAGFGQWGLGMQDDITDGTKLMIKQGIADPKRIGIYGGSYGGYAALAGVTFTPDLYAAAVDYVGISNLFTFLETLPPYYEFFRKKRYEMVGHPEKDKKRLADTSPALHADRITAPVFVAQGANDPRVNQRESDQMVEALRKRGVPVEYMLKKDEGHGFLKEENRFDFYEAMVKFLKQYLMPEPPGSPGPAPLPAAAHRGDRQSPRAISAR